MFQSLYSIFGSKMKAQEIVLLLHDAKPAVRQGFYAYELPPVLAFCRQHELHACISKFKVLLDDTMELFSNKGLRIPEQDPRLGMFFTYLSKDEKTALLASYYELTNNHRELGLILGYPECCVTYFCEQFSTENPNPEIPASSPWISLSQRDKDRVLISHFPCSAACAQSIHIAKKTMEIIKKESPERAGELQNFLVLRL